jgi:hypothetical protein
VAALLFKRMMGSPAFTSAPSFTKNFFYGFILEK